MDRKLLDKSIGIVKTASLYIEAITGRIIQTKDKLSKQFFVFHELFCTMWTITSHLRAN